MFKYNVSGKIWPISCLAISNLSQLAGFSTKSLKRKESIFFLEFSYKVCKSFTQSADMPIMAPTKELKHRLQHSRDHLFRRERARALCSCKIQSAWRAEFLTAGSIDDASLLRNLISCGAHPEHNICHASVLHPIV